MCRGTPGGFVCGVCTINKFYWLFVCEHLDACFFFCSFILLTDDGRTCYAAYFSLGCTGNRRLLFFGYVHHTQSMVGTAFLFNGLRRVDDSAAHVLMVRQTAVMMCVGRRPNPP